MGKINERCAGIDVGKRFLLCCVLTGACEGICLVTQPTDRRATKLRLLRHSALSLAIPPV